MYRAVLVYLKLCAYVYSYPFLSSPTQQECPITEKGLCNSHGHCAYDNKAKSPHCYCNKVSLN